jgi:TPR repeat protein
MTKRHASWYLGVLTVAALPGCGKALALVYDRCEQGDAKSCERVRSMAEKPCQRGEAQACFMLGQVYSAGKGGPKDPAKAREHFDQACERGHQPACNAAAAPASAPAPGGGPAPAPASAPDPVATPAPAPTGAKATAKPRTAVKPDPATKVRATAEAACRGGDPEACIRLGRMIKSNPTTRDKAAARGVIQRACAGKNAATCAQIRKELLSR